MWETLTFPARTEKNGQGRIVYYLDASVPTYYEHSAISKAGTYAISSDTAYTWKEVTPGEHKFSMQLADNNNSPLPMPAIYTHAIHVDTPQGAAQINRIDPSDGASFSRATSLYLFR